MPGEHQQLPGPEAPPPPHQLEAGTFSPLSLSVWKVEGRTTRRIPFKSTTFSAVYLTFTTSLFSYGALQPRRSPLRARYPGVPLSLSLLCNAFEWLNAFLLSALFYFFGFVAIPIGHVARMAQAVDPHPEEPELPHAGSPVSPAEPEVKGEAVVEFDPYTPATPPTTSPPTLEPPQQPTPPALPLEPHGWPTLREFPKWYWKRLSGWDQSLDMYFFRPHYEQLIALLFTCITMLMLGLVQHFIFIPMVHGSFEIFIPALSSTCTCLFAVPKLPVSQPRNIIIGHVSAGFIGISLMNLFLLMPQQPYGVNLANAIGVGLHQLFMIYTNTLHPPASATVVSAVQASFESFHHDRGFIYCLTPCFTGSVVVITCAIILNNLVPSRSPYPVYW
eukprot:gene6315-4545_t